MIQFKYLGRMLEETDSDWMAVHRNINKAQEVCRRLVKLFIREVVDIQVSASFYGAVVQ